MGICLPGDGLAMKSSLGPMLTDSFRQAIDKNQPKGTVENLHVNYDFDNVPYLAKTNCNVGDGLQ